MSAFAHKIVGSVAYFGTKLLVKSLRAKLYQHPSVNQQQQCVYGFWHDKQFTPIMLLAGFGHGKYAALVSASKDGELLASWLSKLGYHLIRGSSSRKALSGLVNLIAAAKQGYKIGIAADGPRGPRHQAKAGTAYIAYKAKIPFVPLGVAYSSKWQFDKAWDKYQLPKPFSKLVFYFGEPIYITDLSDLDVLNQQVTQAIHAADRSAQQILQGEIDNSSALAINKPFADELKA